VFRRPSLEIRPISNAAVSQFNKNCKSIAQLKQKKQKKNGSLYFVAGTVEGIVGRFFAISRR
jgi:hypothetical protein